MTTATVEPAAIRSARMDQAQAVRLTRIAIVVAILATWEITARSGLLYRDVVPSLLLIMRALAHESGAAVVGIDYALSPEAKFPVGIEQCAALARHLHEAGERYHVDGTRLAFAGDSGGANMSLAATLLLRDRADAGEPAVPVTALALYYGLYGLRDSASRRLLGGPWDGLTEADLDYYLTCYLGDPADLRSPYLDCLGADLSRGVPATYLASAELDPLRDDTAALVAMLQQHGVTHRHEVFPGVLHGFLHNSRLLDAAGVALRHGGAFLRHAFDEKN